MELEIIPAFGGSLAEARQAVQDAFAGDDPWMRADALAYQWLKSPRFTDGTRDQYRRIYTSWRTWCTSIRTPPFDAKRTDLEDYTLALEKTGNPAVEHPKPMSRRSVARHMAALSSFYKRAIDEGLTERNPVPSSDRPKVSRQSRQPYLSPEQIRALIVEADKHDRNSALVALLVLACLRISEALSVDIEDLTHEGGYEFLWVNRKGDKGERVLLVPEAHERISRVTAGRRSGPIIATATGRPLDRKTAWATVRKIGERAGISTAIGPHTLRHAYITRGHELQISVADLQDAAGHESVDTTRGYDRSRFDPTRHPSFQIARDLVGGDSTPQV